MAKDVNDSSRFGSLSDKDRAKLITKDRRQPIRDSSLKVTHTLLNVQLLTLSLVCFSLDLFLQVINTSHTFWCSISWRKNLIFRFAVCELSKSRPQSVSKI